jgi:hypothetical protein
MERRVPISGLLFVFALLIATALPGCGSDDPPARPEIVNAPAEELHGAAQKAILYEFRAKVRKHGLPGARQELPNMLETFESYDAAPVGNHGDTYKQIYEKLQALETTLAGSPTDQQVKQAAEVIGTLADKLPGKAEENPQVE